MWKPGQVVESHRRRAVVVWTVSVAAILAYCGWLFYKAAEKAKAPDTSFVLTNEVYKFPDLWICLFNNYGCDEWELEEGCVDSAWNTDGGVPNAVFYPRVQLDQEQENTTEQLQIEAIPENTDYDSEGNYVEDGRGQCVIFKTSAADAFVGTERDPHEFLDYILLDMYWYPGGKFGNSTTCVADGVEWTDHREWVYGFLSDPEDPSAISTGVHLSYSCITNTSNTHTFNTVGIGLTKQNKFMDDDKSSYKALFTNFGVHKNEVNSNITMPYAHLSLEMKQQFDSWEIITESNPYEFAEMFGNIGGFWDLLLILWPLCFVAAAQQDPHLKPRTFKKTVVRGAERAVGVSKAIARAAPIRPSGTKSAASAADGFEDQEEVPAWDRQPAQQQPPQSATTWQDARRS